MEDVGRKVGEAGRRKEQRNESISGWRRERGTKRERGVRWVRQLVSVDGLIGRDTLLNAETLYPRNVWRQRKYKQLGFAYKVRVYKRGACNAEFLRFCLRPSDADREHPRRGMPNGLDRTSHLNVFLLVGDMSGRTDSIIDNRCAERGSNAMGHWVGKRRGIY